MYHQFINEHKNVIPDPVPGSPFLTFVLLAFFLTACDFLHPIESTPEPSEYDFNYWLLQRRYLYDDELTNLPKDGDSVQVLYRTLKDPYTRYVPPSNSEATYISSTTSIVAGDLGMRYFTNFYVENPLFIINVYPKGPAGRAGVPKYGQIISANDIEIKGDNAKKTYDSIVNYSKKVNILVAHNKDTVLYKLEKETVYAPTVFVDTLFEDSAKGLPGIIFIAIEGFKLKTADQDSGTYGELKSYLDSTTSDNRVRVLDLRNNPGGYTTQCIPMADLFSKEGTLSSSKQKMFSADGGTKIVESSSPAKPGHSGEKGKYLILANRGTASCAEIFIAAVTETTNIPLVGKTTYGKGIGQSMFYTVKNGLATITDVEFFTPKGNSYNGKGIEPKYKCEVATEDCAAQVANQIYGVKISASANALAKTQYKRELDTTENLQIKDFGGAIQWGELP